MFKTMFKMFKTTYRLFLVDVIVAALDSHRAEEAAGSKAAQISADDTTLVLLADGPALIGASCICSSASSNHWPSFSTSLSPYLNNNNNNNSIVTIPEPQQQQQQP